jgi:taurine dioxygenase
MTVQRLTGALGAEVRGVDLATIDDAQFAELHALWLEHLVLFFPEQDLAADVHVAFARRFGEPEIHPYSPKLDAEHPEIMVLDTVRTERLHTDVTFSPAPPLASILHMVHTPPVGGDTVWMNQYLAFETLSPAMREMLRGLTARHTAAAAGHPEVFADHPVVRIHPETGREALYVNSGFTSHILELTSGESDALLNHLFEWSAQLRFQCRYRWADGTVAIWDNRCTQHSGVVDYTERRVLQRITVLDGVRPTGHPARWEPVEEELAYGGIGKGRTFSDGPTPTDERANSIATDTSRVATTS